MNGEDTAQHRRFLQRAVALSREGMERGAGGPFGALVVRDGVIVGEGWNRVTSGNDPTAHAEMEAIRDAARRLQRFSLAGCVIYSSCEPCPMCLAACHWARLAAVYYANTAQQAAAIGFDDALIRTEVLARWPAGAMRGIHLPLAEAQAVFQDWQRHPARIPY